jgi:hypothetical protein
MEGAALIEMAERLYFQGLTSLKHVITNDDSKMKAICKWNNEDFMRHHGLTKKDIIIRHAKRTNKKTGKITTVPVYRKGGALKYPVPEPVFLAYPAHRKKTYRTALYKMKKLLVA